MYLDTITQRTNLIMQLDHLINPNIEIPNISIDYAGILQMFYKNNNAYIYWNTHYSSIVPILFNNNEKECYKFLKIAFHYYNYEDSLNRSRISTIWQHVLEYAFLNKQQDTQSRIKINLTIILCLYYNVFTQQLHTNRVKPPLEFIKYILRSCMRKHICNKFEVKGIYHSLIIKTQLETVFTNLVFEENNRYIVYTSLHNIIKMNPVHNEYLEKIILTRLLCLKHFTNNYEIYFVVTEYMRKDPQLLF